MKLAFVFPGQGSQAVGMLDSLKGRPEVADLIAEADAALDEPLSALIAGGPADVLALTVNTQPAMLLAGLACYRAWRAAGGPDAPRSDAGSPDGTRPDAGRPGGQGAISPASPASPENPASPESPAGSKSPASAESPASPLSTASAESPAGTGGQSAFSAVTIACNVASPAEVEAVMARAAAAGARVTRPPSKAFWGGYTAYFADPDGHLWEVAHNPFWTFDETGAVRLPD